MVTKNQQALLWSLGLAALVAFGQELSAGNVPIPRELAWLVPVAVASINALTPNVRRRK